MTTQPVSFVFAAFLSAAVFFFSSCSEDEGDVSASGKASLRISVAGISAGGEESLTRAALEPQTVVLTADDGTPVEFTLSVDPASVTRATSPMDTGKKYRVIAYKSDDNSYAGEELLTAGIEDSITGLDYNTSYKLAAFSYNTEDDIAEVGQTATTLTVDPSNDLLHWVGSVTPVQGSPSPTVNITFKHRFPKLTVRVTSTLTGNPITAVPASASLTPAYLGVQTLLTNGAPGEGATVAAPTFTFGSAPNDTVAASTTASRYVFTGDDNPVWLTFSGQLTVDAPSGPKTLTNPAVRFATLQSGYKYTLTMRVEASRGDYYPYAEAIGPDYEVTIPLGSTYSYTPASGGQGSTTTLTFLRYNLGADPSMTLKEQMAYPYTDVKNIRVYGGLFQWGRKDVYHTLRDFYDDVPDSFTSTQYTLAAGPNHYDPASISQKYVAVHASGWLSDDCNASNLWGNGGGLSKQTDFSYNTQTPFTTANFYNPCPNGYRVPTQHEWALISNEGGSSTDTISDTFVPSINGRNTIRSGTTWYIPVNHTNVVWVRVSDGKPSLTFASNTMNGYALYSLSALNNPNDGTLTSTFDPTVDLTAGSAPNPLIFLPATGQREWWTFSIGGSIAGIYCSSTVVGASVRFMAFGSVYVTALRSEYRLIGRAVRCIKEYEY